ncbi:MAG: hypothetical protein ABF876_05125 [Acetobacter aceti]
MIPSVARFNALLSASNGNGLGQNIAWESSDLCPCRSPAGTTDPNCPQCRGLGHIWAAPVAAWSGMASMRISREWGNMGEWESGDIVMTIPSDSPFWETGEYDRVTLIQSSEPFSRVLVAGKTDRLAFMPLSIRRVFWLSCDESEIIEGGIPTVNNDGSLVWPDGDAVPAAGQRYTVSGRRHPIYFMFRDFPQDRAHASGLALPRRVVLRKFDLLGATQSGVVR